MAIVSAPKPEPRLTRLGRAHVHGRVYRNPRYSGNPQPWQSGSYTLFYIGRHAIVGTLTNHVRFVELPGGDVRKIRVFAS